MIHDFVPHFAQRLFYHLDLPYPEEGFRTFLLCTAITLTLASLSFYCMEDRYQLKRYFPYGRRRALLKAA